MRIVVDAMGSDNHPTPDVEGAVLAAKEFDITIILVGNEARINAELNKYNTTGLTVNIQHTDEKVTMEDIPSRVVREKKESSMHVGINLVKRGEADAFVTAGNSGAALVIAMLRNLGLGRIPGIKRPALGVIFPTRERPLLIDNGANADCKAEFLYQFGVMGSLYVERVLGIKSPRVALISNGEEEGKGNQLIKEAIPLLENSELNYIGNIEPKEFMYGATDVAVTDGFTGNIMMKMAETTARYMSDLLKENIKANPIALVGGLLTKSAFGKVRKVLDPNEVGGAPLLGVNGVVIIGHGRSNAYAIKQAVGQAKRVAENDIVTAIAEGIKRE